MSTVNCRWVEAHLDEVLSGGGTPSEREDIDLHLAVCARCRENARIWSFLLREAPRADMPPLSPEVERRLLSGSEPAGGQAPPHYRRLPFVAMSIPTAAAAMIGALWLAGIIGTQPPPAGNPSRGDSAPRRMDTEKTPAVSSRSAEERIGGRRAIPVLPGTTLWLSEDAEVGIEILDAKRARFHLTHGYVVADIEPVDPDFRFVVATPGQVVEARGTVFSVSVTTTGEAHVRVSEGAVEIRSTEGSGHTRLLHAGQEMTGLSEVPQRAAPMAMLADLHFAQTQIPLFPSPYEPDRQPRRDQDLQRAGMGSHHAHQTGPSVGGTPDRRNPEMLLKRAKELRGAREYKSAAATYEEILASFPRSREAAISMVALGQLRLSALRQPEAALALFDAYLERSPRGNLGAAARSGRVRALSAMDRHREVIHGVNAYLETYPTGATAAEMRRRKGEALAALGDCPHAVKEFQYIVHRWPDSAEATRARAGLDVCDQKR